jgi:hypothetical protein
MGELQRLTTEYVEIEDRMRISGELADKSTVTLWVSQRLLLRLLPHLFLWLEKQSGDAIPAEIIQSFEQEAAKSALSVEPPVKRAVGSQEYLVETVDLTPIEDSLALGFRQGADQVNVIALPAQPLRQWLEILFSLWGVAEWPNDVWPDWIASKKVADLSEKSPRIH